MTNLLYLVSFTELEYRKIEGSTIVLKIFTSYLLVMYCLFFNQYKLPIPMAFFLGGSGFTGEIYHNYSENKAFLTDIVVKLISNTQKRHEKNVVYMFKESRGSNIIQNFFFFTFQPNDIIFSISLSGHLCTSRTPTYTDPYTWLSSFCF